MLRKIFRASTVVLLTGCVLLLVGGCLRYGPQGFARRVQNELGLTKAHPAFVPTPLAVAASAEDGEPADTVASQAASQVLSDTRDTTDTVTITVADVMTATDPGADATGAASPTPQSTPLPPPEPTATFMPAPPAYSAAAPFTTLSGLNHEWPTWNNCGPATLGMQMSYFGSTLGQGTIGDQLRTHEDDKNVLPNELVAFAQSQGYYARAFVNGDSERLKLLLSNGVPVLVETWLEEDPNDGMGHYRLLAGYDDAAQHWIAYDSYISHNLVNDDPSAYAGVMVPYAELEPLWKVFNRTYLLVYTDELVPVVEGIIGSDMDDAAMWQRSVATAQAATATTPGDAFAWFNLGSSLTNLGDYAGAAAAFDQARVIGLPWRMLWYQFEPFQAYDQTGRYSEIVALADATIATTRSVEELFFWKGRALAALGDTNGARLAWQEAVALNPTYTDAHAALDSVGG